MLRYSKAYLGHAIDPTRTDFTHKNEVSVTDLLPILESLGILVWSLEVNFDSVRIISLVACNLNQYIWSIKTEIWWFFSFLSVQFNARFTILLPRCILWSNSSLIVTCILNVLFVNAGKVFSVLGKSSSFI